jgi:hypothetical protein
MPVPTDEHYLDESIGAPLAESWVWYEVEGGR